MNFSIGIATKSLKEKYYCSAITWFESPPTFSTHGLSLPFMQEHLLSVVNTSHKDETIVINAAVHRSAERLFLKKAIHNHASVEDLTAILIVPQKYRKYKFIVGHRTPDKHWLLNGAKRALDFWLEQHHGRLHKSRS